MESGTIVRWLKGEGDAVKKREPLYELDTDKVTQEVEAEADGVLLRILVSEGEVDVGTTVAVIGAKVRRFPSRPFRPLTRPKRLRVVGSRRLRHHHRLEPESETRTCTRRAKAA